MLVKVVLEFVPSVRIEAKHTTTISASITAYSTAVGPSSDRMKRQICEIALSMTRHSEIPRKHQKLRTLLGNLSVAQNS